MMTDREIHQISQSNNMHLNSYKSRIIRNRLIRQMRGNQSKL